MSKLTIGANLKPLRVRALDSKTLQIVTTTGQTLTKTSKNNIYVLNIRGTSMVECDLSALSQLKNCLIDHNQLTTFSLSGLHSLKHLDVSHQLLTRLELNLPALEFLDACYNQLESFDTQNILSLKTLGLSSNPLKSLDVRPLVYLGALTCRLAHPIAIDMHHQPNHLEVQAL